MKFFDSIENCHQVSTVTDNLCAGGGHHLRAGGGHHLHAGGGHYLRAGGGHHLRAGSDLGVVLRESGGVHCFAARHGSLITVTKSNGRTLISIFSISLNSWYQQHPPNVGHHVKQLIFKNTRMIRKGD